MQEMGILEFDEQQSAATRRMLQGLTYALALLMPFSVFFAISSPVDVNVFALYAQPGFYLSDLPLAFLLVITLTTEIRWRRGPLPITVALLVICILAFVSVPEAYAPPFTVYVAVRWLLAFYLYLWFLQRLTPARSLVLTFAGGLSIHAIVGIFQVAFQGPLNLPGEFALRPEIPGAAVLLVDGARLLRAYGLAFHPNVLGGFLAIGLLLLMPWLERLPAVGLWWLMWTALWLTFSRSAWLAVGLTMPLALIACFIKRPQTRHVLILAASGALGLFLGFLLVANDHVRTRLSPIANRLPALSEELPETALETRSLSERAELVDLALDIIEQRPFGGIGAGNFPLTMPRLRPQLPAQSVHSVPLLLASEIGIPGALLWLFINILVLARFIVLWRKAEAALLCAMCAWMALALIALFDSYPWALNSGLLLTAMVLGLASRKPLDGDGSRHVASAVSSS